MHAFHVTGLAPDIPEDLYYMIKKAVVMRKHLEVNRKDKDGKFRLILVESRIHRLARYYKVGFLFFIPLPCSLFSMCYSHVHPFINFNNGVCWCVAASEEVGAQLEVRVIYCLSFGCIDITYWPSSA